MAVYKRRQLLIDPKVQGSLIRRVVIYWLSCVGTVEFLALTWDIATGPEQQSFFAYFQNHDWQAVGVRLLISSFLLIPITYDMLRLSNRFAGPVYRMRRILRKVATEGIVEGVHLREDDYWHEFAEDLNAALSRLSNRDADPENAAGSSLPREVSAAP